MSDFRWLPTIKSGSLRRSMDRPGGWTRTRRSSCNTASEECQNAGHRKDRLKWVPLDRDRFDETRSMVVDLGVLATDAAAGVCGRTSDGSPSQAPLPRSGCLPPLISHGIVGWCSVDGQLQDGACLRARTPLRRAAPSVASTTRARCARGAQPAGLSDTTLVLPLDVVRLELMAHGDRVAVLEHIADQTAHVYR